MSRILFVFLDGVGVGPSDPAVNPFLRARLPTLRGLLGDVPTDAGDDAPTGRGDAPTRDPGNVAAHASPPTRGDGRLVPLDACLGLPGLPQSGTGQISLLTGENAARLFGRHFGPWPPVRLRPLLAERNLLVRAQDAGARVVFANAYPEGYPEGRDPRRVAAPPLAAAAAGLLTRHADELAAGRAVASEIVNEGWRRHLGIPGIPSVEPVEAGRVLARLTGEADLTFYAHYLTDLAGHRGGMPGAVTALERVDAFLGGVLDALQPGTLLLIASDHGNIEDVRGEHTRNPAFGMAVGPGADRVADMGALTDVAPRVLEVLGL